MTIALLIVVSFLLLASVVVNFLLVKAIRVQVSKLIVYENWIQGAQELARETYDRMNEIDRQQAFASDDEVGTIFKNIVKLIENLNQSFN